MEKKKSNENLHKRVIKKKEKSELEEEKVEQLKYSDGGYKLNGIHRRKTDVDKEKAKLNENKDFQNFTKDFIGLLSRKNATTEQYKTWSNLI